VKELCDLAFKAVDLNWQDYVKIDSRVFRPAEVDVLVADAGKAHKQLAGSRP